VKRRSTSSFPFFFSTGIRPDCVKALAAYVRGSLSILFALSDGRHYGRRRDAPERARRSGSDFALWRPPTLTPKTLSARFGRIGASRWRRALRMAPPATTVFARHRNSAAGVLNGDADSTTTWGGDISTASLSQLKLRAMSA
jgi:hypothetical protein